MATRSVSRTLALRTALFVLLMPGTVVGFIPYLLIRGHTDDVGPILSAPHMLGVGVALAGAALGLWCVGLFSLVGKGTPAPIDPPKELVVAGAYRVVRNPMYVGVACVLIGEAVFFGSGRLAAYVLGLVTAFHFFVVLYEEPVLRRKFGKPYEEYCLKVSRWLPSVVNHK